MRKPIWLLAMFVAGCSTAPTAAASILITGADGSVSIWKESDSISVAAASNGTEIAVQPTPSPRGDSIVYSALDEDGDPLVVVWREGDIVWEKRFDFLPFYYSWNADGSSFVALGNSGSGVGAAHVIPDTNSIDSLGVARPYFFSWAPSTEAIATNRDAGSIDLLTPGLADAPLGETTIGFQAPDWLDDETVIVPLGGPSISVSLLAQATGRSRLAAVSLDGSTRDLVNIDGPVTYALSPDRARLAVLDGVPGEADMLVLSLAEGSIEPVEKDGVVMFEWSPDGSALLLGSIGQQALVPSVWTGGEITDYPPYVPTSTFVSQYLQFWGQYVRSTHTWAPDGSAFTYAATTDDGDAVFIQRLGSDPPDQIAPGSVSQWLQG